MKFLLGELTGKRPLMPQTLQTSAEQADVLNTFRTIAQLPGDSLGAYVISMARSASDVLAVVLLQVCTPHPTRHCPLLAPLLWPPPLTYHCCLTLVVSVCPVLSCNSCALESPCKHEHISSTILHSLWRCSMTVCSQQMRHSCAACSVSVE